jgi:hypothetical protein
MNPRRILVPVLAALLLFGCVTLVEAQSGPIQGSGPIKGSGPVGGPGLTAERVVTLLKEQGHKASVEPGSGQGKVVVAQITQDGWGYEVLIQFTTDGKKLWLSTPLSPAGRLTPDQLRALMKKSFEMGGTEFFMIGNDDRLVLETPNFECLAVPPFSVEQVFFQKLNRHLDTIRNTYNLWKVPAAGPGAMP